MNNNDWGVIYRILDDEEEHALLRLHILQVPANVAKPEIKKALERAGRTYGEGRFVWGNHSILPQDRWPDGVQIGESKEPVETITFADLLDEGNGERRVTLRLPVGLHAALVKSASGASTSLNQFCLEALALAVSYDLSPALEANLSQAGSLMGISEQLMADIIRFAPIEVKEQMLEQSKAISALPAERVKNRTLASFSQAAAKVAEQAERLDAFSDEEWEAMAAKSGCPGAGLDMKAEHARNKANRPEFLAHMSQMFAQKADTLRELPADEIKALSVTLCDALNPADAD